MGWRISVDGMEDIDDGVVKRGGCVIEVNDGEVGNSLTSSLSMYLLRL